MMRYCFYFAPLHTQKRQITREHQNNSLQIEDIFYILYLLPEGTFGSFIFALDECFDSGVDDFHFFDVRRDDISHEHRCEIDRILF